MAADKHWELSSASSDERRIERARLLLVLRDQEAAGAPTARGVVAETQRAASG